MKSWLGNVWLQRVLAVVVGGVFLYASHDKIWWPARFARIVYHYQIIGPNALIPPLLPNLLAVTMPWVEALSGLALISGLWRREAALVTALMLAVFITAVGWTLYQGIDVENCGCFNLSAEGRRAGWALIVEDVLLLVGAALIALLPAPASGRTQAAKDIYHYRHAEVAKEIREVLSSSVRRCEVTNSQEIIKALKRDTMEWFIIRAREYGESGSRYGVAETTEDAKAHWPTWLTLIPKAQLEDVWLLACDLFKERSPVTGHLIEEENRRAAVCAFADYLVFRLYEEEKRARESNP